MNEFAAWVRAQNSLCWVEIMAWIYNQYIAGDTAKKTVMDTAGSILEVQVNALSNDCGKQNKS